MVTADVNGVRCSEGVTGSVRGPSVFSRDFGSSSWDNVISIKARSDGEAGGGAGELHMPTASIATGGGAGGDIGGFADEVGVALFVCGTAGAYSIDTVTVRVVTSDSKGGVATDWAVAARGDFGLVRSGAGGEFAARADTKGDGFVGGASGGVGGGGSKGGGNGHNGK